MNKNELDAVVSTGTVKRIGKFSEDRSRATDIPKPSSNGTELTSNVTVDKSTSDNEESTVTSPHVIGNNEKESINDSSGKGNNKAIEIILNLGDAVNLTPRLGGCLVDIGGKVIEYSSIGEITESAQESREEPGEKVATLCSEKVPLEISLYKEKATAAVIDKKSNLQLSSNKKITYIPEKTPEVPPMQSEYTNILLDEMDISDEPSEKSEPEHVPREEQALNVHSNNVSADEHSIDVVSELLANQEVNVKLFKNDVQELMSDKKVDSELSEDVDQSSKEIVETMLSPTVLGPALEEGYGRTAQPEKNFGPMSTDDFVITIRGTKFGFEKDAHDRNLSDCSNLSDVDNTSVMGSKRVPPEQNFERRHNGMKICEESLTKNIDKNTVTKSINGVCGKNFDYAECRQTRVQSSESNGSENLNATTSESAYRRRRRNVRVSFSDRPHIFEIPNSRQEEEEADEGTQSPETETQYVRETDTELIRVDHEIWYVRILSANVWLVFLYCIWQIITSSESD